MGLGRRRGAVPRSGASTGRHGESVKGRNGRLITIVETEPNRRMERLLPHSLSLVSALFLNCAKEIIFRTWHGMASFALLSLADLKSSTRVARSDSSLIRLAYLRLSIIPKATSWSSIISTSLLEDLKEIYGMNYEIHLACDFNPEYCESSDFVS